MGPSFAFTGRSGRFSGLHPYRLLPSGGRSIQLNKEQLDDSDQRTLLPA